MKSIVNGVEDMHINTTVEKDRDSDVSGESQPLFQNQILQQTYFRKHKEHHQQLGQRLNIFL